ncbi:MAG: four-carbon acid sugar kinase family protein [Candidatus Bathyarchaeia archaeon]
MKCRLGVIADDYTGSNDTGVQFAKKDLKTMVLTRTEDMERAAREADVVVVDTESRADPRERSYMKTLEAAKAMKGVGVERVYKKIDSTLRGNIGPELEAIMDTFDISTVVIAPAYPKNGRVTVGGFHLLHQTPLEKTEIAHDPRCPVRESHVPTLIQGQTRRKVGHVSLSKVMEGFKPLLDEIRERRERGDEMIVIDAVTQDDLKTIAKATASLGVSCLTCGCAGLAEEVPEAFGLVKEKIEEAVGVVVIAGSVSGVTMKQISKVEELLGSKVIELSLHEALKDEESRVREVNTVLKEAEQAIERGKDVVVCLARSDESVTRTRLWMRERGISPEEMAENVLSSLGEIASTLADNRRVAGLVLTGGDTAISVCKALGVAMTEIKEEILPGIPLVKVVGGRHDGMRIVTKAGAFGDEDAMGEIIQHLKRR